MGIEENKESMRKTIAAMNNGEFHKMQEDVHPEQVFHISQGRDIKGTDGEVEAFTKLKEIIPDIYSEILDMTAEGDKVITHLFDTGTVKGEMMGVAPTDRKFSQESLHINRFKDGKSIERWEFRDRFDLYQQYGVIPPLEEIQRLQKQKQTEEENKKSLYRLFEEVWNKGNLSVIPELISPDYVGHNPRKDILGIDDFEKAVKDFHAAVPDGHWTVDDIFGGGDKLAVSFTITGTQTISYKDKEPTGEFITNKMLIINRYVDGKCVESTPYNGQT